MMIFNLNTFYKTIRKNNTILFPILLIILSIVSTQFYNSQKKILENSYKELINNIYFKKSLDHIFNNLSPKYKNIEHRISKGETFDKILKDYDVPDLEIFRIKEKLIKDTNLNNLNTDQVIKFTIDQTKDRNITLFLFPLSRTEKIQLVKNTDDNLFIKKKNYNKLK